MYLFTMARGKKVIYHTVKAKNFQTACCYMAYRFYNYRTVKVERIVK